MKYKNICEGVFVDRPNRFIARVLLDGREETVHVKNTGRLRELLYEGGKKAVEKLKRDPKSFTVVKQEPPYEIKCIFRKSERFPEGATLYKRHETSFIAAMNSEYTAEK